MKRGGGKIYIYRDRFQSHRWTTPRTKEWRSESGKKQRITASRLPFVREGRGWGKKNEWEGRSGQKPDGLDNEAFYLLTLYLYSRRGNANSTPTFAYVSRYASREPTTTGPNKCKIPPPLFLPILRSTTNALSYIERVSLSDGFHFDFVDGNRAFEHEAINARDEPRNPPSRYIQTFEAGRKEKKAREYFRSCFNTIILSPIVIRKYRFSRFLFGSNIVVPRIIHVRLRCQV